MNNLITIGEAAEILRVSKKTLRDWDKKGILKALRVGNRKDRRYNESELQNFVKGK